MVEQIQTGTEEAAAAGQQQTVEDGGDAGVQQATAPADGENQDVQVEAFKTKAEDEVKKRQAIEAENENLKQQMQLITANQASVQPQVPAQPKTLFEQCAERLGFGDGSYLTGEQHGQVLQLMIQVQGNVATTQNYIQSHPDFVQVAGTIHQQTGQLIPSAELQKILTEKPQLRSLAASPQGAYELVMQERKLAELEKNATANQEHLTRQEFDNKTEPLGGSAAGGGGAGDPNNQQMMSREQVREIEQKLADGEQV